MRVASAESQIGKYKHTSTKVNKYKIYKYTQRQWQRHKYTNMQLYKYIKMWDPVASAEIKIGK